MVSFKTMFGRLIPNVFYAKLEQEATEQEATPSQLFRLPPEIILSIASILPTASAACLALCCHRLNQTLGPKLWETLRNESPDVMLDLLTSLAKDRPEQFACRECVRLHRTDKVGWPGHLGAPYGPRHHLWSSPAYRPLYFSPYSIAFIHVKLAMKQHYDGTDFGLPLDAFWFLQVNLRGYDDLLTLLSVDAQIVHNEFLLRIQNWTLLPWARIVGLVDNLVPLFICEHTDIGSLAEDLVILLATSRIKREEAPDKYCSETFQCRYCWMEYMLQAVDFGERGLVVILTRWLNMGAGLDDADTKWQGHITRDAMEHDQSPPAMRGIRIAFESNAEVSLEDLTAANHLKLLSKRRMMLLTRAPDGLVWQWDLYRTWYLYPAGPPVGFFWRLFWIFGI
ncbi:hypothetical protein PVAG01_05378 [Phlyctema vagabunda]|uniref:F-box domain-containing protein n=1 Tax=Phlyctema vagabunda TaxID=108571 RepID=A0ABR4PJV5_9HELO